MPEANSMPDLMYHHVTVFTAKTNRKGRFPADTANITPAAKKISFYNVNNRRILIFIIIIIITIIIIVVIVWARRKTFPNWFNILILTALLQ